MVDFFDNQRIFIEDFVERYVHEDPEHVLQADDFDLYIYLKFDAHKNIIYEKEKYYYDTYAEKIIKRYDYDINSKEFTNTIKTMCYLDTFDLNINWEEFFNNYGLDCKPIYYYNLIKKFQDIIVDDIVDDTINVISSLIKIIITSDFFYETPTKSLNFFYVVIIGFIRCLINKGFIVDIDNFFTAPKIIGNDYSDLINYGFIAKINGMILDYLLYNNIKFNIKSKYTNELNMININTPKILENNLYKVISNIITDYNQASFYYIIDLYVEKYGGWQNIVAFRSELADYDNILKAIYNDENLNHILFFKIIKFYSNYLQEKYHNINDTNPIITNRW